MKKIIALIMVLFLMVCCLCSCTVKENTVQGNNTNESTLPSSLIIHIWADGSLYTVHPTEKGGVQE